MATDEQTKFKALVIMIAVLGFLILIMAGLLLSFSYRYQNLQGECSAKLARYAYQAQNPGVDSAFPIPPELENITFPKFAEDSMVTFE